MTTFCISDLHLGDRGPRDNFCIGDREARFYRFLDYVRDGNGRLLVLGDLFDWWTTNLSASVRAYRELIDRLASASATWVTGNHDNALDGFRNKWMMPNHVLFLRSQGAFEEIIAGKRFAFLHGHESDPYCHDLNPGIGEITAIISGLLEDRNRGPIHNGHPVEDEFVGRLEAALTLWPN